MKLGSKKITGTLIIFSTLLLTACGGGSNQSNDKKSDDESSEQNALYKVYYQPFNVSSGLITDFFEITTYLIQDDQINFNKSHNQPLDRRILTESKRFTLSPVGLITALIPVDQTQVTPGSLA